MPDKIIIESFGPALNFFESIDDCKKALAFYVCLDDGEWNTFYKLILSMPLHMRLDLYNHYRNSFNLSEEDIRGKINALDSKHVKLRQLDIAFKGEKDELTDDPLQDQDDILESGSDYASTSE